jgi:O-antigen ligase
MREKSLRDNRLTAGRVAFVIVVLLWTAVGEEHAAGGWRFWYGVEFRGVPSHFLLLGATVLLLSPYVLSTPRWSLTTRLKETGLWPWLALAWIALVVALFRAILTGAPDPFVDWRNLVVFAGVGALFARWLAAQAWRSWVLSDVAIGFGLVAIPHLVAMAMGGGTSVFGVRTPTFFGPLLYMAIFASITLTIVWSTSIRSVPIGYRALVRVSAVASTLLVILSFRRSFWLAWGIGMVAALYLLLRPRWASPRGVIGLASALLVGVVAGYLYLGADNVSARLISFLPSADNEFSATNEDHVNDLIDALDVISAEPIFGYGIGRPYETNLIAEWKTDSFEVHNAVLHAWLKFGLLGAVVYLGFHLRWMRSMWDISRVDLPASPMLAAAAIYLGAGLVATMVGTWPYGSTQMAVFHGVLLAGFAVSVPAHRRLASGEGPAREADVSVPVE